MWPAVANDVVLESVTVESLVERVRLDDVSGVESALRRAAVALGPRRFVTDLAHPFMVAIGDAWAARSLAMRQEHLATECVVTQPRSMIAGFQDVAARPLVLLAALPDEEHTLALQMVALYLALAGAKPRLVGGAGT